MSASRAQQTTTAERRAKAVALRLSGTHLDVIAEALDYSSPAAVSKDISRAMTAAIKVQSRNAEELRMVELMRLDRVQRGLWPAAIAGDVKSAETVLKIIDKRCRLLGLDTIPRTSENARSILGDLALGLQLAHNALAAQDGYQEPTEPDTNAGTTD
ncbi:hypothetical protein JNW90_10725 [Micromonospora sp. STR1s_5]|nr:hypothetical protein [Micromonospora sp. STR1s_5]